MNDAIELFLIDEDGNLIINKKEILVIKEYNALINRNKGKKNKYDAMQELLFVYLMLNPKSMYIELPSDERYDKVKEHCKLEDEWIADDIVIAVMERYENIDLKLNAFSSAYYNTKRGIYSIGSDISLLNEISDELRKRIKEDKNLLSTLTLEVEIQECKGRIVSNSSSLLDNSSRVLALSDKYPKALDTVELLYKKMKNKEQEDNKIYGGGKLNNREE